MENYIGVKRIKAKPMNRLEYNEYRGWNLPSDEDGTDEGFLVEYIDGGKANHPDHKGYISWSPKEVFENAYKISNTWEDRVKIELDELITKITDLSNALDKNLVPKSSVEILGKQLVVMEAYKHILIKRLGNSVQNDNSNFKLVANMTFGEAIEALKQGLLVARKGWNKDGMCVMKQVPAEIGLDIIPNMQSLQPALKTKLIAAQTPISYRNQMILVQPNGIADSWVASSSDIFAEDWFIL
jgi:hypothetical protein